MANLTILTHLQGISLIYDLNYYYLNEIHVL